MKILKILLEEFGACDVCDLDKVYYILFQKDGKVEFDAISDCPRCSDDEVEVLLDLVEKYKENLALEKELLAAEEKIEALQERRQSHKDAHLRTVMTYAKQRSRPSGKNYSHSKGRLHR